MLYRNSSLRRAGWILAISGISGAVTLFLIFTWLSRRSVNRFNAYVDWANVISMTFGALGVIIVMVDKVGALTNLSAERISNIADDLSGEATRQDGYL
jgi:multisubunit Na+/H+ antiporter MnhB subunit